MGAFEWFSVAQTLAMAAAAIMVWLMGRDREASVSKAVFEMRIADLTKQLERHERESKERFSRAGQKTSDLSDTFYRVAEEMRRTHLASDRASEVFQQLREERKELWDEIQRLRARLDVQPGGRRKHDDEG